MDETDAKSGCYNLPPLLGIVTPLLTFLGVEVGTGNYSVGGIIGDAIGQFLILLLATVTGLIPFLLLSAELYLMRNHPVKVSYLVCAVGTLGVAGLTVLGSVAYWYPMYAGEHVSSTASLVFMFVPVYGCMAAVAALVIGLAASLIPWFRQERDTRAG